VYLFCVFLLEVDPIDSHNLIFRDCFHLSIVSNFSYALTPFPETPAHTNTH